MKKMPYLAAALAALVLPTAAFAHARVSPPVSLAKQLQLYSLVGADGEGERHDHEDRPDGARRVLDRLVRAEPRAGIACWRRPGRERAP